jgi:hypothetical protein
MAYGLEVKNDSGISVIDNSLSYEVLQSGSAAANATITFVNTTGVEPLIFIRPAIGVYGSISIPNANPNSFSPDIACSYKVVVPKRTITTGTYGLLVYNESGNAVIDSDSDLISIDSISGITRSNSVSDNYTTLTGLTPPSGHLRYVLANPTGTYYFNNININGGGIGFITCAVLSQTIASYRAVNAQTQVSGPQGVFVRFVGLGMTGYY